MGQTWVPLPLQLFRALTVHISARCAIRRFATFQNSPVMKECTRVRNPTSATPVTRASVKLLTWHTTSAPTVPIGHINAPFVRRPSSIGSTWCGTCTLTLASTFSSATCASCISRSRPNCCTTSASRLESVPSAVQHAGKASNDPQTSDSMSAPIQKSGLSSVRSVR